MNHATDTARLKGGVSNQHGGPPAGRAVHGHPIFTNILKLPLSVLTLTVKLLVPDL